MKFLKEKIKFILVIIVGILLLSGISVYAAYKYFAKDVSYTKADGTKISVEEALNELYNKLQYTPINKEYLESGSLLGNTIITENNLNSSFGLSITGNNVGANRWEKEIDLTNISVLSFYAKKGANHGSIHVLVDDKEIFFITYSAFETEWKKYYVDLSEYQGIHKLTISGGWGDSTGSTSSNTQYCDIRLY